MAKRAERFPKLPLVRVEWTDSAAVRGWASVEDWKRDKALLVRCSTIGFLVQQNKRCVAVAQTVTERGRADEVWAIPSKAVHSVTRLR